MPAARIISKNIGRKTAAILLLLYDVVQNCYVSEDS